MVLRKYEQVMNQNNKFLLIDGNRPNNSYLILSDIFFSSKIITKSFYSNFYNDRKYLIYIICNNICKAHFSLSRFKST